MKTKFIKPETTSVGGKEQPCRLRYKRGGAFYELPVKGAFVPTSGAEGMFWARRIAEGSAKEADPPKLEDGAKKPGLELVPRSNPNKAKEKAAAARAATKAAIEAADKDKGKGKTSPKKPKPGKEG